jgi:hypothetical protein
VIRQKLPLASQQQYKLTKPVVGTASSIAARPLPTNTSSRGILFGALAVDIYASLGLVVLLASWSPELSFAAILRFKIGYDASFALACILIILVVADCDRDPAASSGHL